MRLSRYRFKTYLILGPFEIQYGHLSRSLALFRRRPWSRLLTFG